MTPLERSCVFIGSRENAVRCFSRLVACGIKADVVEELGSSVPYAMGGSGITRVFVAPGETERAKTVLADVEFK